MGGAALLAADTTMVAVPSRRIVESLDVVGDVHQRDLAACIDPLPNVFRAQAGEKRFRQGMVPEVAFRLMLDSRHSELLVIETSVW
jgi:hypothetical protein